MGLFGIQFASATTADTTDAPKEIPVPANLLWIDQAVNHSWGNHADEFESKQQLKDVVVDTVQNAKGGDVKHKAGFVAYWNDKEGVMVIKNVKNPERSTAFHPDEGRDYFDHWK